MNRTMKKRIRRGVLLALLAAAAMFVYAKREYIQQLPIGCAFKAKAVCAGVFISGRAIKISFLPEDVSKEKTAMKRKDFLKIAAAGAAVGLGQLALSACKSTSTPTTPSTSKTFTSSITSSHTHTVSIARTEIDTPPAGGFSRDTSIYSGHSHTFTIAQADLATVAGGGTVNVDTSTVTTTYDGPHFHTFTISKWYAAGKSSLNF